MTPPDYTPTNWVDDDGSGTTGTLYNATRMNNIEGQLDLISDLFVTFKATLATDAVLPGAPTFAAGVFTASGNTALTVDSASAASGDVILVKNETRPERNGIYIVNKTGGASEKFVLNRHAPQNSNTEIFPGELVSISKGTVNNDSVWQLTSDGLLVPNSTPQEFSRVAPGNNGLLTVRLATNAALPANGRVNNVLTANANAALTVDGKTVAVGDLVLVKNETPDKHNGVYIVTAAGAAGAKWVLERATGFKASQDIVSGSVVMVSAGTRNSRRQFTLTTTGAITVNTTALTFALVAPKDFGLVIEPPTAEALEGDRCTYLTEFEGSGVFWQFIYDGVGEFPWKYIGGPPLYTFSNTSRELTNETAYKSLPTDPLKILAPLKGDYDITISAFVIGSVGGAACFLSYAIGATAASDNWGASFTAAGASNGNDMIKTTRQTGVAAAAEIIEKARTTGNWTNAWTRRRLSIVPVRVG